MHHRNVCLPVADTSLNTFYKKPWSSTRDQLIVKVHLICQQLQDHLATYQNAWIMDQESSLQV
jgi:hypothetical protein